MPELLNLYPAQLIYLNFQPLEVVSRYRDPQLQVTENYLYLFNLSTNIRKSWSVESTHPDLHCRHTFHSWLTNNKSADANDIPRH